MKTKDFSTYLDDVLLVEAKTLIKEQVEKVDSSDVKHFQTLQSLEKYTTVDNVNGNFLIKINNVTNEMLIHCFGGNTIQEAQKRLIQGLQYDFEEAGLGDNIDLDLSFEGDENTINLTIKVETNNDGLLGNEMKNKELEEKKTEDKPEDLILGGKEDKSPVKKKKKVIRMTETQMVNFLNKMLTEAEVNQPYTKTIGKESSKDRFPESSVPGAEEARTSRNDSGKVNQEHLKDVDKKMKDYASFEGNDNPEFPKQIGKGEKVARENTDDQEQEIEDNDGRGPQDLDYDIEPGEGQKERIKKGLTGDSTMGNGQEEGSNTIKTDTGEKMLKNSERRKDIKEKEPLYNKESVPTKQQKENVNEEIMKMKNLFNYNVKTQ